jgi:quercetin dioxygenase-like cupin family protein
MGNVVKKSFDTPDNTMDQVEKVKYDVVEVGGLKLSRATAEPGWKWSVHIKPVAKTDSCQMDHVIYVVSGSLAIVDDEGQETDYVAGDVGHIPPGHDGWTIGNENAVWIDIPH